MDLGGCVYIVIDALNGLDDSFDNYRHKLYKKDTILLKIELFNLFFIIEVMLIFPVRAYFIKFLPKKEKS